jgi:hypothetical protein
VRFLLSSAGERCLLPQHLNRSALVRSLRRCLLGTTDLGAVPSRASARHRPATATPAAAGALRALAHTMLVAATRARAAAAAVARRAAARHTSTAAAAPAAAPGGDLDGVTIVSTREDAQRVAAIMAALPPTTYHAWDTEVADIDVANQSPVGNGRVICASVYSGPHVDYGTGPRLWIDNLDAAEVRHAAVGADGRASLHLRWPRPPPRPRAAAVA